MVLEEFGLPKRWANHPFMLCAIVFVVVSLSLGIALYMDEKNSSILSISFIVIAFVPMMHNLYLKAEREEVDEGDFVTRFFFRHKRLIGVYFMLFVSIIFSYGIWYCIMPSEHRSVFQEQDATLGIVADMRQTMTGNASVSVGSCGKNADCWREMIFSHNFTVMLLFILLSFLYGAGALYLVIWNASTLGVLIGQEVLREMAGGLHMGILQGIISFLGLIGHGIPEAGAYFLGAIAGGILSVAIISPKYGWKDLRIIIDDIVFVLIIAVFLLWIGAIIESETIVASLV